MGYGSLFLVALATAACGTAPGALVDVRQHLDTAGRPGVDVHLRLQPEHARLQSRYIAAAASTLKQNSEWFGPPQRSSLAIVDPPWPGGAAAPDAGTIVLEVHAVAERNRDDEAS